jgi:YspA, cpYpsA-related SLOG family
MKILVTGDRGWTNEELVDLVVSRLPANSIVVHGACSGADEISGCLASKRGHEVREYPADWKLYGRAAGGIRNQEMLDREHRANEPIDAVFAFHEALYDRSRGTLDMCKRAEKTAIKIFVVTSKGVSSFKSQENIRAEN